ncbi:MAG: hypothetical protein HYR72_09315 [Deltaproteobacteria bacterium]|nr:hypothetical protein [Deltaproteobacteria bacterium]MBI3388956.1 hypothetical protein [Deltaproteobacteria bacterium]
MDPIVMMGLGLASALLTCLAILYSMRDATWSAPRVVSESVWCPLHRRQVAVDFLERVTTGMSSRSVQNCPLRGVEGCGEACSETSPSGAAYRSAS